MTCRPPASLLRAGLATGILALALVTGSAAQTGRFLNITDIIADRIQFNAQTGRLIAEGNVRFIHGDWEVLSESFLYENDRINIEGPIYSTHGDSTVLLADQADINPETMAWILRGVRLLVNEQQQLASSTFIEDDAGNIIIRDAIVTACRICKPGEEPLWHFRASAMIVPANSRRAYLKDPVMTVGPLEVGGIPWLSVPADDGRYSGFLFPSLSYSNDNGASVQLPYFLALGDHAGLTFAPGASTKGKAGLEYDYEHRFTVGELDLEGAINRKASDNSFIEGRVDFTSRWRFTDQLTATASHSSDNNEDHEHITGVYTGDQDLSVATLTRRSDQTLLFGTYVRSNPLPGHGTNRMTQHVGIDFRHQIHTGSFELAFKGWAAETRIEDTDLRSPQRDPEPPNEPPELVVQRYGLTGDLSSQVHFASGLVARFSLLGTVDRWHWNEGFHNQPATSVRASLGDRVAAIDLSLPLVRNTEHQAQALEPFVQLVYVKDRTAVLPALPRAGMVLDPGNIRTLDRFANDDLREKGLRVNMGAKLTGHLDNDAFYDVSFGTIYRRKYDKDVIAAEVMNRDENQDGDSNHSPILEYDPDFVGRADHVLSATYHTGGGLSLNQTVHISKEKRVRSAQSLVEVTGERQSASAMVVWSRPTIRHKGFWGYTLATGSKLTDRITLDMAHSVGSEQESAIKSSASLVYRHQCAVITAGVERTAYRSSSRKIEVEAALTFRLGGFRSMSSTGQELCR